MCASELQHSIDPLWITLSWRVTDMGIIHRRFLREIDHQVGTKRINPETEAIKVEGRLILKAYIFAHKRLSFSAARWAFLARRSALRRLNVSKTVLLFATKDPFTIRRRRGREEKKKNQFLQITTGSNQFCNVFYESGYGAICLQPRGIWKALLKGDT